jgi:predicted ATPase
MKVQKETGHGLWDAELHRVEAIALTRCNRVEEAERAFEAALRIARRQQAKAYELRAAMNLARLWGEEGRRDEARDLLAPIYGWFTEGFDTADLKDAKALLNALA